MSQKQPATLFDLFAPPPAALVETDGVAITASFFKVA
jgi:hypothetical protein